MYTNIHKYLTHLIFSCWSSPSNLKWNVKNNEYSHESEELFWVVDNWHSTCPDRPPYPHLDSMQILSPWKQSGEMIKVSHKILQWF